MPNQELVFYPVRVWDWTCGMMFFRKLNSGSLYAREFINWRQGHYLRCYCCRPHVKNSGMGGSL